MDAINENGIARVTQAIVRAEARTSAEIFCVVARVSDDYRPNAGFRLLARILLIAFAISLLAPLAGYFADSRLIAGASLASAFGAIALIAVFPGLCVHFVPLRIRHERAHANAVRQFLAHGITRTQGRTGVLVFVSLTERYAEIIADAAIADRLGQEFWNSEVETVLEAARAGNLAEGLAAAIDELGAELAKAFPRDAVDRNELADRVVLL
jgi:putative membrane protein